MQNRTNIYNKLGDFRGTLKELSTIVSELISEYGESAIIEFYAGHENIDCDIIDYTTRHRLDKGYKERFEDNPETAISHERGMQISEWLLEKKYTVNNYLVLDDSLDASYGHEKNYYRPASPHFRRVHADRHRQRRCGIDNGSVQE